MLGGNIRRDDRDADQRPSQPPAGEEEVRAVLLMPFDFAAFPDTESDDENEKSDEDNDERIIVIKMTTNNDNIDNYNDDNDDNNDDGDVYTTK